MITPKTAKPVPVTVTLSPEAIAVLARTLRRYYNNDHCGARIAVSTGNYTVDNLELMHMFEELMFESPLRS